MRAGKNRQRTLPSQVRTKRNWSVWIIPCLLVFVLIFLFSLRQISDVDIGFHLRGGQWMLTQHSFHHHDVFTYTVNNNEYTALHWLYQILLFLIYLISGYSGITLVSAGVILIVFASSLVRMRIHNVSLWVCTILLFVGVLAMEVRFSVRPELATWVFLVCTLLILDLYTEKNLRLLFFLPIFQLFWVNLHGLFILGWVVIIAYYIQRWIHAHRIDRYQLGWSVAAIVASCVNPYFLKGIVFPFYLFTRLQSANIFKIVNAELQSPLSIHTSSPLFSSPIHLYFFFAALSIGSVLLTLRKRKIHEFILIAAFLYLSLTAMRNIALFIVVALPIVACSCKDLATWLQKKWPLRIPLLGYTPYILSCIVILISLRVTTNAYYLTGRRATLFGTGLNPYSHPVAAAQFITDNKLTGRMLNDFNTGSWLIWRIPQPVFVDGRMEVMQERFFTEYRSSFMASGLLRLISKYHPDLILFDYSTTLNWQAQIERLSQWRLVFLDEKNALYLNQAYAPEIPALQLRADLQNKGIDTALTDPQIWTILQTTQDSRWEYWLKGFVRTRDYPHEIPMRMALFAYSVGDIRATELLLLAFLRRTTAPFYEPYFNLGAVYMRLQDFEKARYCYERVLRLDPRNVRARQYYRELSR